MHWLLKGRLDKTEYEFRFANVTSAQIVLTVILKDGGNGFIYRVNSKKRADG